LDDEEQRFASYRREACRGIEGVSEIKITT
jgi:hypothetical protein